MVAIQIGLTEELLVAVRAGERPLASVFIQMSLERGGAGKRLPTLIANVVLQVLSFLTSVYVTVHFQPVCTTETPPAETADEWLITCVYSLVMHQMCVTTELLAAQLASEFFFNRRL